MTVQKPLLVCTAVPGEGHFNPVMSIASHMQKYGYDVAFVVPKDFKEKVIGEGMEFYETVSIITEEAMGRLAEIRAMPTGLDKFACAISEFFLGTLALRHSKLHESLEKIKENHPDRQIIIIEDVYSLASTPYKYGRPLPKGFEKAPRTLGVGCSPLMLISEDIGPLFLGLPPDSTPSGKLRNKALHKMAMEGPMKPILGAWEKALTEVGCTDLPEFKPWNTAYEGFDVLYQMCSPSMDYPASDMPSVIKFPGIFPRKETKPDQKYPEWWSEVTATKEEGSKRQVVFVSQGTVCGDYTQLIEPTLKALAGREDVLVVAVLGVAGGTLPEAIEVPSNVRVTDYLGYDIILEHAEVFVTNGGYGAFTHAARNGCPIVVAGETEDKLEVALRAEYCGLGVNVGTQTPTPEQVKEAVNTVLGNAGYKKRALGVMRENEKLNSLETIRQGIEAFRE